MRFLFTKFFKKNNAFKIVLLDEFLHYLSKLNLNIVTERNQEKNKHAFTDASCPIPFSCCSDIPPTTILCFVPAGRIVTVMQSSGGVFSLSTPTLPTPWAPCSSMLPKSLVSLKADLAHSQLSKFSIFIVLSDSEEMQTEIEEYKFYSPYAQHCQQKFRLMDTGVYL